MPIVTTTSRCQITGDDGELFFFNFTGLNPGGASILFEGGFRWNPGAPSMVAGCSLFRGPGLFFDAGRWIESVKYSHRTGALLQVTFDNVGNHTIVDGFGATHIAVEVFRVVG